MDLLLFDGGHMLEARLLDDAGLSLYAPDIIWEVAPVTNTRVVTFGNLALIGSITGSQRELRVKATRGALAAELDLVRDPEVIGGAYWTVKPIE